MFRHKRCKKIPDSPHYSDMKLWVSNPMWALLWFSSPSNWLRSTPHSLPKAFITHVHAADSTWGFSLKMYANVQQGEEVKRSVRSREFCLEFELEFKATCPAFFVRTKIANKTAVFPSAHFGSPNCYLLFA